MGLICASIYILLLILFIPFPFSSFFVASKDAAEGLTQIDFPLVQVCFQLYSAPVFGHFRSLNQLCSFLYIFRQYSHS